MARLSESHSELKSNALNAKTTAKPYPEHSTGRVIQFQNRMCPGGMRVNGTCRQIKHSNDI